MKDFLQKQFEVWMQVSRMSTFDLSGQVDEWISIESDTSIPSSFKISKDGRQFMWLISSILQTHASMSALYFSTQAADDATTATSPKMSMINPDNLQEKLIEVHVYNLHKINYY